MEYKPYKYELCVAFMLLWLFLLMPLDVIYGQDKTYQYCNARAKLLLNLTFDETFERFSPKSNYRIQLADLRPGICESTFLIHGGRIYSHNKSRSMLVARRKDAVHLRHMEFFFPLLRLLKDTEDILKVKLPTLLFNLETQDNPTCRYPREELKAGELKAVKGIVHHSFCSPELCDGTTLLPISYNQNINAMRTTKGLDRKVSATPWRKRIPKLFWRGSNAGKKHEYSRFSWNYRKMPRSRAIEICSSRKDADVKFGFVPWKVFMKHKYVLALAGNTYASLFKHALRSGGCILRQEERMYEWFEPFLKEWVHYIPVNWDLSNLLNQLEWAKSNDEEAQQISFRAKVLGEALFSPEIMACYTYCTLIHFHKKFDVDFLDIETLQNFKPVSYVCKSKRDKRDDCMHVDSAA